MKTIDGETFTDEEIAAADAMDLNSVDFEIEVLQGILRRLQLAKCEEDRARAAALAEKVLPLMEAIDRLQHQRIALKKESGNSVVGSLKRAIREWLH